MKPKISVIIPVYNGEKTLKQCITSVLNQTYKNYEVIVVDNNSTDKTKKIIKKFQDKDKKIKYLFEPKIGRGAARYKGEISAQGDIILMTDSDCIVPHDWIVEMIKPIIKNYQVAVQGVKKAVLANYWTKHIQKEEENFIKSKLKGQKIGLVDTANFAIKRDVLQHIGYTDPRLSNANDLGLMARLISHGYYVRFQKIAVSHYHADTALKLFTKWINRGYWIAKFSKMYKRQRVFLIAKGGTNHLLYFLRLVPEFFTLHRNFKYDFVAGIAWRIGWTYGWIKK